MIDSLTGLVAVAAPFVMIVMIARMRTQARVNATRAQGLAAEEQRALDDMHVLAARMETRIGNLERVLDAEVAGWRSRMPA